MSEHVLVAKKIRVFLKEQGISGAVKAKSYANGSTVAVVLQDVNPEQMEVISEFCNKFQKGSFNSLEDLYVFDNIDKTIPQVHHVIITRSFSDELRQKALDVLHAELPDDFVNVPKLYSEISDLETDSLGDYIKPIIRKVLQNGYLYENLWKLVF